MMHLAGVYATFARLPRIDPESTLAYLQQVIAVVAVEDWLVCHAESSIISMWHLKLL